MSFFISECDPLPAGDDIVKVLGFVLEEVIARNNKYTLVSKKTKFDGLGAPEINIRSYLDRIFQYANCSNECFVLALIFVDRIIQRHPDFYVSNYNIHRLFITGVMVAAKFFDDVYFNNAFYARVGGISLNELNELEIEFLFLLNFTLHTDPEEYEIYRLELVSKAEGFGCTIGETNDTDSIFSNSARKTY
eukprot:c15172_g1_i1.p1 GENE.c15172_g1_i1~~c15172_g1_i1.p1  ORF type:complete len:191 (+),score=49.71 c15172_g1_i1:69-641(+)